MHNNSIFSAFDLYRHILLGGTSTTFYGEALKAGHDCKLQSKIVIWYDRFRKILKTSHGDFHDFAIITQTII